MIFIITSLFRFLVLCLIFMVLATNGLKNWHPMIVWFENAALVIPHGILLVLVLWSKRNLRFSPYHNSQTCQVKMALNMPTALLICPSNGNWNINRKTTNPDNLILHVSPLFLLQRNWHWNQLFPSLVKDCSLIYT